MAAVGQMSPLDKCFRISLITTAYCVMMQQLRPARPFVFYPKSPIGLRSQTEFKKEGFLFFCNTRASTASGLQRYSELYQVMPALVPVGTT